MLVIEETGERLGIMLLPQALQVARERDLDLVEVASGSNPPVCRLLDYGKYRYDQTKKDRESRKGQKSSELRDIRIRPNIGDHDLDAKLKLIRRLVGDGDRVRVTMFFRGREHAHPERGQDLFKRMLNELKGEVTVEQLQLEERRPSLILLPLKQRKETPKKAEGEAPVTKDKAPAEVSNAKN